MSKFKSGIILKDEVIVGDYDICSDMLMNSSIANKVFIFAELFPSNGDVFSSIDSWEFRVNQTILPEWYRKDTCKQRMIDAVKEWAKNRIYVGKDNLTIKSGGGYCIKDCKNVVICGDATVREICGFSDIMFIRDRVKVDEIYDNVIINEIQDEVKVGNILDDVVIRCICDSVTVSTIMNNVNIEYISDFVKIQNIIDNVIVEHIYGGCIIEVIEGNVMVNHVYDDVNIINIFGNVSVMHITDRVIINNISGNVRIGYLSGYSRIERLFANVSVGYMYDYAVIEKMSNFAEVKSIEGDAKINCII